MPEHDVEVMRELESKFWLEFREPRCVPIRKGPWPMTAQAKILREAMVERPAAYITVVTISADGPEFEDGPQALQMADARSMSTGSAHIKRTRTAHDGIREALASDTDRSEAEAGRPAEGVRPPGETLWLAHGAMFGSASGDWDDLDLVNKLRWASVEDSAVRNLMAQSNTTPPARGREASDG